MFRFTLRELLLLLAAVAVGCAALKYAGEIWFVVVGSTAMLTLVLTAIVVAVDRGRRQAAALGVALSLTVYGLLFMVADDELPSQKALQALYWTVVSEGYMDPATGREVLGDPMAPPAGTLIIWRKPDYGYFLAIGHLLCALALGYVCGRCAVWVYNRRVGDQPIDKLPD